MQFLSLVTSRIFIACPRAKLHSFL